MEKGIKVKYFVDAAMVLTLLLTAITGIINLFIAMLEADDWNSFLGINPIYWLFIHVFFAVITVVLVIVHLMLHKDWISLISKKIFEKKKT